jgi:hypothetical protein
VYLPVEVRTNLRAAAGPAICANAAIVPPTSMAPSKVPACGTLLAPGASRTVLVPSGVRRTVECRNYVVEDADREVIPTRSVKVGGSAVHGAQETVIYAVLVNEPSNNRRDSIDRGRKATLCLSGACIGCVKRRDCARGGANKAR